MPFWAYVVVFVVGAIAGYLTEKYIESLHNKYKQRARLARRNGKEVCLNCEDNPALVEFKPCGHALMCQDCGDEYLNLANRVNVTPRCPRCRKVIDKVD